MPQDNLMKIQPGRGKALEYLGMKLDYITRGRVKISIWIHRKISYRIAIRHEWIHKDACRWTLIQRE